MIFSSLHLEFRTNQTRQKALCPKSLASLLLSHQHQPETVGSLKKNTTLEYSTRVVQEGDRRCEKSTLNDLAYLTPLRIPLMNPVKVTRTQQCKDVYGVPCPQLNNSKLCK